MSHAGFQAGTLVGHSRDTPVVSAMDLVPEAGPAERRKAQRFP
jgi:hypothetical protein